MIEEVTTAIATFMGKVTGKTYSYEQDYRHLIELKDKYRDIPVVYDALDYTLNNFSNPSKLKEIREHVTKVIELQNIDDKLRNILNILGLEYDGREFIDIRDILTDELGLVVNHPHPLFNDVYGNPKELMYINVTDDDKEDIYEDLFEKEYTYKTNGFVFTLLIIKNVNYVFGVNRRENIIIFSSLLPLIDSYRIKNRRKVDKKTYKGVVFPNYSGNDQFKIGTTIVDREYLIGAIPFLESLGVRLQKE